MAAHSSTLAWKIPWTEEPGRLQSMGSPRVGHDWATSLHFTSLLRLYHKDPIYGLGSQSLNRREPEPSKRVSITELSKTHQFSSIHSFSHFQLLVTPWSAACQASLSITNSQSLLKLMYIESVTQSNHLILWCPLLLLPSIFPRITAFSDESVLHIRRPKYCSFSFKMSPSNEVRTDFL